MNDRKPQMGDIVLFSPGYAYWPEVCPAIVTKVLDEMRVELIVFVNHKAENPVHRLRNIPYSATREPNTWHWKEEA